MTQHRPLAELQAGLEEVRRAPADLGSVQRIVRRPAVGERESVETVAVTLESGMDGDDWLGRGSRRMADGSADREAQITMMNSRFAALIAGPPEAWDVAGDQLYVDLDLSESNLPPGARVLAGGVELEVSAIPHTGCAKFSARFGSDALRLVSSPEGRALRLRGVNARVVRGGVVRTGDAVRRS